MRTNAPWARRWRLARWSKLAAATALVTSVAITVSGSGVQPLPATSSAAASSDGPDPAELAMAASVREDQCRLGFALRKGGAEMRAVARAGLHGTDAELRAAAAPNFWDHTPLSQAYQKDRDWARAKMNELSSSSDEDHGRVTAWWKEIPALWPTGADIPSYNLGGVFGATGYANWIAGQFWTQESDFYENLTPLASREAAAAVTEIGKARYSSGSGSTLEERQSFEGMTFMHGMYADDARLFLQTGGFPTTAPDPGTLEFRIDVENLKARFASCASQNPPDPNKVLGPELTIASTEWQSEIAGQKDQSDTILGAEAKANEDLQIAAQAMGEAIAQSTIESVLQSWQASWAKSDPKTDPRRPTPDQFADVERRIVNAQARATGRVFVASRAALDAKAQAAKVDTAQQAAYAIADAAGLPRGRGLMYAQQAAQITKASAAAALAASKATETAMNATRASVADGKTLNALAMTQAHASKAEFRRKAAEEAAAQAKAAADGAALQATKAAENAAKAKAAQAKAEAAEKTAKNAAADAKAKRATAESERDNAKAQKEIAAAEQAKAAAADKQAQSDRSTAATKLSEAQAAGKTASEKKDAAVAAESKAAKARDNATDAEVNRDALTAKASALEAKADADESTDAAQASRAAATQARTAANEATTAAANARTAANAATTAAADAREAATKAEASAARAKAASDGAQRDVAITHAAVTKAHAAAADAISASEAAAQNARTAKALADTARAKAVEAKADATIARNEANAALGTSIQAAGFAYATSQASLAARDSAAQVVQPANDAIELGSPYKETDTSAGLAVLTGQAAKNAAEQQQAVAKAKADQAAKAAADAAKLAAQADADAKAAATAAAEAAASAARAAVSVAKAQASAKEAADAAKAAKKAEANTIEYDRQATEDAAAALAASTEAGGYAQDARGSADAAESNAASARNAADAAESDASAARGVADQAEKDATTAETAAAHAQELADEAQQAAQRTESTQDAAKRESDRSTDGPVGLDGVVMRPSPNTLVDIDPKSDCVGTHSGGEIGCEIDLEYHVYGQMDFFLESCPLPGVSRANCGASIQRDYLASSPLDVRFRENRVHINGLKMTEAIWKSLVVAAFRDVIDCRQGKLSGCLWLVGSIVVPAALGAGLRYAVGVRAAVRNGARISEALWGLRFSGLSAEAIAGLERVGAEALVGRCFPAGTKVATSEGPKPIEQVKVGDRVWSIDLATGKKSLQPVLKLFNRTVDQLVEIRTAGGRVEATDSHRFWVQGRGWVESRNLRTGDRFQTKDGSTERVLGTTLVTGKTQVFNFEVDNGHTYYVYSGSTPVLVHNECIDAILKDLVNDGDHILLGINPMADDLAESLGARTFNGKSFGRELPEGLGMGKRPIWTVGVERAVSNPRVPITVSLDGVEGAKTVDEALELLLKRGETIKPGDWETVRSRGYGTAWEMTKLRTAVRLGEGEGGRNWSSIQWYMTNAEGKAVRVRPERFKLANGTPVPDN
ncbi:polymorphic toxin type 27 domain-containing protein [Streptomyces sp. NPDC059994]|uniref:polymorphic toxin type 27 domain-containing protein n=1 Tax=Streptomyces sp. NPDC059994 TaxID=3347029 RepID=UPI0036B85D6C